MVLVTWINNLCRRNQNALDFFRSCYCNCNF